MKFIVSACLSLILFGCQTYSEQDLNSFEGKIEKYIEENNLDLIQLESGLFYKITQETDGAPFIKYTDQVTFYYSGEFLSGEVFQEISEDDPLIFQVRELIAGWQEGLMQLHGPGSIELIIPPHLGYGSKDTGKIPPNSILRYTLTVTEVK